MATAENTAPAGAHSPAVPESIIRAAAEAPSPPVFLEFDELLETLLNLVSHLRCADGVLYELQVVPEPLRGAGIVLHDAVENLAGLHNRLQEWPSNADREARYAGATDAHATWSAELPGAVAQSTHPFSRTAPGSRRTCRTCCDHRTRSDHGGQRRHHTRGARGACTPSGAGSRGATPGA